VKDEIQAAKAEAASQVAQVKAEAAAEAAAEEAAAAAAVAAEATAIATYEDKVAQLPTSSAADVLVVECNWRLAPKANKLSASLHAACDRTLKEDETKTVGGMKENDKTMTTMMATMKQQQQVSSLPTAVVAGSLVGHSSAQVEKCYPVQVPQWCALAPPLPSPPSSLASSSLELGSPPMTVAGSRGLSGDKHEMDLSAPEAAAEEQAEAVGSGKKAAAASDSLCPKWVVYVRPPNLNAGRGEVVTPGASAEI
jgi:hypothetical protein